MHRENTKESMSIQRLGAFEKSRLSELSSPIKLSLEYLFRWKWAWRWTFGWAHLHKNYTIICERDIDIGMVVFVRRSLAMGKMTMDRHREGHIERKNIHKHWSIWCRLKSYWLQMDRVGVFRNLLGRVAWTLCKYWPFCGPWWSGYGALMKWVWVEVLATYIHYNAL